MHSHEIDSKNVQLLYLSSITNFKDFRKGEMSTVYIINKGCHDYNKATKFGQLHYLSIEEMDRFSTGKMYRIFKKGLKDSQPEDYILISGMTIMSVVACSIFAAKHGRVNLLLYNFGPGKSAGYVERTVMLEELS